MSTEAGVNEQGGQAVAGENEPPVAEAVKAAPPAPAGSTEIKSQGQVLVGRFLAQFNDMMEIHRRLVSVKRAIVAGPAANPGTTEEPAAREKEIPFFSAFVLIADGNDAAITAIKADLQDIEKLF